MPEPGSTIQYSSPTGPGQPEVLFVQALINRTSEITESVYSSAMTSLYLASYLGFSYMALSVAATLVSRMFPGSEG